MSRCEAFDLFNGNFVFQKEKEHMGSKLTEPAGLTRVGRDELKPGRDEHLLIRIGLGSGTASKYMEASAPTRTSRSSSLPFAYQENIPRPATGSGFIAAGAI